MFKPEPKSVVINMEERLIMLECGHTTRIETMMDEFCCETDDPEKCVAFVYQLPNGRWTFLKLSDLDEVVPS